MIIKITVRNKIAMLAAPAAIVCGNSDYSIQFDFDDDNGTLSATEVTS